MSSRPLAYSYLENMQRKAWAQLGWTYRPFFDWTRPSVERVLKEGLVKTKYENPGEYKILTTRFREIKSVMHQMKPYVTTQVSPFFGTAPLPEVTAWTIPVGNKPEYLVVFGSGVFYISLLLSKIIARCFPPVKSRYRSGKGFTFSMDVKNVRKQMRKDKGIYSRFRNLIESYLYLGGPGAAEPYSLQDEAPSQLLLTDSMLVEIELFILAHEYGHASMGHLENTPVDKASTAWGQKVEKMRWSGIDEFEADGFGAVASSFAMEKANMEFQGYLWGPEIYLAFLEFFPRAASIAQLGQESGEIFAQMIGKSHPVPKLRLSSVEQHVSDAFGKESSYSEHISETRDVMDEIFYKLWLDIEPFLLDKFKRGKKVHPRWLLKKSSGNR